MGTTKLDTIFYVTEILHLFRHWEEIIPVYKNKKLREEKRPFTNTFFSQFLSWEAYLISQGQFKTHEYYCHQLLKKEKLNATFTPVLEGI